MQERMCLAEMKHIAEIHMQSVLKRPAAGANDFEPPSKLQAVQACAQSGQGQVGVAAAQKPAAQTRAHSSGGVGNI